MDNCKANQSIGCTVKQCVHHCDAQDYCSLDKIMVGTHEANPTMNQCTDCESFKVKSQKNNFFRSIILSARTAYKIMLFIFCEKLVISRKTVLKRMETS